MKYLKNESGTLFIKDLENGRCAAIQSSFVTNSISYEKFIHFSPIKLLPATELEMQKAWKDTLIKLSQVAFGISIDMNSNTSTEELENLNTILFGHDEG